MNLLAGGALVAVGAGLFYFLVEQKPADVYDMPVSDAYSLLTKVDFGKRTEGEQAAQISYSSRGNGRDKVFWGISGSHTRRQCDIQLTPFEGDAARTHVAIACQGGGAGEGAAAGIAHNMVRNRMIERIDATLTGREYDVTRVGASSSRWPGDGVDGSLGTAAGKALEMNAEMNKMQREWEAEQRAANSPEARNQAEMDAFYASADSDYSDY